MNMSCVYDLISLNKRCQCSVETEEYDIGNFICLVISNIQDHFVKFLPLLMTD